MIKFFRLLAACISLSVSFAYAAESETEDSTNADTASANIPRFVSLRSDEVNLRTGPGTRYPIKWVYRKENLPVEVVEEFEHWRKIKLPDGEDGWIFKGMLSGKRTVLIKSNVETIYQRPELNSPKLLRLEKGVVAELKLCSDDWCQISIAGTDGWLKKSGIFGVYSDKTAY